MQMSSFFIGNDSKHMSLQFQWKLSPVNCQWQKRLQSSSNAVQCQKMAESRRPGNPGGFLLFWPDRYEATVVLCPWVLRVHVLMYSFQYEYRLRKQDLTVLLTFGVHTHTHTQNTQLATQIKSSIFTGIQTFIAIIQTWTVWTTQFSLADQDSNLVG